VVLYDNLVSDDVLRQIPQDAERIYVGKQSSNHTLPQEGIIELMVRLVKQRSRWCASRVAIPTSLAGGEEAEALVAEGIACETVPGISAAQGASASTGIPLTHRDHTGMLVFATGHLQGEGEERSVALDWAALARPRQTVVIYMGVGTLPVICTKLVEHGLPGHTPAALVERATRPDQRTIVGTLETLPALSVSMACTRPRSS
jgi:uroporphyrin-III C-methyltransferase